MPTASICPVKSTCTPRSPRRISRYLAQTGTSFVSSWESLDAVNDGIIHLGPDPAKPRYGTWGNTSPYVKLDYNETIGLGCDGAESLGEGLRRQMAAVIGCLRRLREQVPGIQVELCASGGHRLEPSMLTEVSFASFSDAHECVAIPIVAANLHRVMQPAQSQIWAVVRKDDSLRRLSYSLCAAMLGSMCISGDVCELSPEQWDAVEKGLAFYRSVSECIRRGVSRRFGPEVLSYNSPEGWQGVLRTGEQGKTLAVLHRFGGDWTEPIRIPWEGGAIESVYDCCGSRIWLESGTLCWEPKEPMSSAAVLLG